mgnify:CR=1 FL=1
MNFLEQFGGAQLSTNAKSSALRTMKSGFAKLEDATVHTETKDGVETYSVKVNFGALAKGDDGINDFIRTSRANELAKATPIGAALPASPGAATGKVCLTSAEVVSAVAAGEAGLLIRLETSPEDIEGMAASAGILTAVGGATSHAAVVARGMGICCISGMKELHINEEAGTITIGNQSFKRGDYLSLDGETGKVYSGKIKTQKAEIGPNFSKVIKWAEEIKNLTVYANADTPKDVNQAVELGAKGVGLCRTEHMFFDGDKITSVRKMILATSKAQRIEALAELLPYQYEDFKGIFEAAKNQKVSIRLLDPPLH